MCLLGHARSPHSPTVTHTRNTHTNAHIHAPAFVRPRRRASNSHVNSASRLRTHARTHATDAPLACMAFLQGQQLAVFGVGWRVAFELAVQAQPRLLRLDGLLARCTSHACGHAAPKLVQLLRVGVGVLHLNGRNREGRRGETTRTRTREDVVDTRTRMRRRRYEARICSKVSQRSVV